MRSQRHPDPDQLDRLRAGLLDDQPETKAGLEAHIAACASCQDRCNWQFLEPRNLGLDADALQQSLRNARRQALQAGGRRRPYNLVPYATAALLLIAVSIGIWTLQPDSGSQQQLAAQDSQMVPDIYEDLEFYLWLANQNDNGNADEDASPNKT